MIVGIRLKHLLVSGVLGALHLTFRIGKLFGVILRLLLQPFTYLFQWIFRFAVVPFYKVCVLVSKRLRLVFQTSRNGILLIFTSRYTVHGVFGLLLFLVLANNVIAREIPIDEFGEQSMIVGMVNQEAVAIIETSEGVDFYQESLIKDELGSLDASSAPKESIAPVDREIAEMTQGSIIQPTLTSSEDSQVFDREEKYIVKEGETISEIAEQFGVSLQTILDENGLTERSLIKPGQTLTILVTPSGKAVRHTVKKGDTLSSIAKVYSVSEDSIIAFNNLSSPDQLQLGQTLIIDGGKKPAPQPTSTLSRVASFFTSAPAGEPAASIGGSMGWPASSRKINQGVRAGHPAIDINCDGTESLFAAESGTVASSGWSGGYGLRIVINHGGGVQTLYGHFSKLYVQAGERVSRGQAIAACGSTGYSTGTHVHFEVRVGGRPMNPWSYLR